MRLVLAMLLLGLVFVTLRPASGAAQVSPLRIDVTAFTCGDVLELSGEKRDRVLTYFNGYLDGKAGTTVWVDEVTGARIDRAIAQCKTARGLPLLDAFTRAWNP